MNLKWISFDTFQSADSIQLLRQKGFTTGTYRWTRLDPIRLHEIRLL